MFQADAYRAEFQRRIAMIRRLLSASSAKPGELNTITGHNFTIQEANLAEQNDVSREIRGLSILLLFAAYENLIKTTCRGLLEEAQSLKVGNRHLTNGFLQFAIHHTIQSAATVSEGARWKDKNKAIIRHINFEDRCTINTNLFPDDGSYMKSSQIHLFCEIFSLGDPGKILKHSWGRLNTIVTERNKIAHGLSAPDEIGRAYTKADIEQIITKWEEDWLRFLDCVAQKARKRTFFVRPET